MLITSMNHEAWGDTLVAIMAQDDINHPQTFAQNNDVVRIFEQDTNKTLGYNFFNISHYMHDIDKNGQVVLNEDQVAALNDQLTIAGFTDKLQADIKPKFVVGYVKTCEPHPDSDHMHVCMVDVGDGQTLQIVCGAPNIEQGQKVVVALVGAMMPTGAIIWPGKLRGVESDGMICSARELALPHAPQKRGILVLPNDWETGSAFDFAKGDAVVAAQNN